MEIEERIAQLKKLKEEAKLGGGQKHIDAQHTKGKLTARERINLFLDPGTFEEIDPFITHRCTDFGMADTKFWGDAVVSGYGKVNNQLVLLCSQDFTVFGGSLSEVAAQKFSVTMDLAARNGAPFIQILDSGGARIQEGPVSLEGYGEIFTRNTIYSGTMPQITVILGPTAGGAVYSPAITDFIFMVEGISQSYITGPKVVKAVTGEDVTLEELGGAMVNATKSGNCHFVYGNEEECFQGVRKLLSFLPQSYKERPPYKDTGDDPERMDEELSHIVPAEPNKPYDMKRIVKKIVDNGDFFEIHEKFARNCIIGFARMSGRTVGIIGQQPMYMAGVLDIDACDKIARFVRLCDCFNIPLVTLVDVPGYMPGTDQEFRGIIRHGAKILFAYSEATVPKLSIVIRKAYGGAYIGMSSKTLRGDINYAWPTAEIAVMGPEGAVDVLFSSKIKASADPNETRQKLIQEYRDKFANPYVAAARGYIDDVIDPRETRPKIIKALEMLQDKEVVNPPKKHNNIPL